MNIKKLIVTSVDFHNWQRFALLIILSTLVAGCSTIRPDRWYLHDPVKNEQAIIAKSKWKPVQNDLWIKIIDNQKITSVAEINAQKALQQAHVTSKHFENLGTKWSTLIENTTSYKKELEDELGKLKEKEKAALEDKADIGKLINTLIKEEGGRKKALDKAEIDIGRWQAELIFLEKATKEFILQEAVQNRESNKLAPKSTKAILDEILNEKITITIGGEEQEKTVGEVLPESKVNIIRALSEGNNLSNWTKLLKENGEQLEEILAQNTPGLTFQILSLGSDIAKAELNRKIAIRDRLQEEINLFSNRINEINHILNRTNKAVEKINHPTFKSELDYTVSQSIDRSIKKSMKIPDSNGIIDAIQTYVLAEDLHLLSKNQFAVTEAALIHKFNIQNSMISAKEQEAFIQYGLESLAAYHAGGITQEEIRSILQAAQAVALGVISGGVLND